MFISRSSLWTRLDFKNIDKTNTYIQLSRSSPLKFYLKQSTVINNVVNPLTQNIRRLKSLTINLRELPGVLQHFRRQHHFLRGWIFIPSMIQCSIIHSSTETSRRYASYTYKRPSYIFPGKIWRTSKSSTSSQSYEYGTTQILNFLESAPLLHTVSLSCPLENPSDPPPGRIVHLRT